MQNLFIFIPTYRRPRLLMEQLERLRRQTEGNHRIRVVVSDNDYAFAGMGAISQWCAEQDNFTYRRNPANIGANANISLAFALAEPDEVLWILADDTLIADRGIELVMKAMEVGADLYALSEEDGVVGTQTYTLAKDGIKHAVYEYPWGLVSSALYDMRCFAEFSEAAFQYHNSSFPHLAVLFSAAESRKHLDVYWLPSPTIHEGNIADPTTDYSVSLTGFPQLFWLAPTWERRTLSKAWLWRHGSNFHELRGARSMNHVATTAMLIEFGGASARILLVGTRVASKFHRSRIGAVAEAWLRRSPWALRIVKPKESRRAFDTPAAAAKED